MVQCHQLIHGKSYDKIITIFIKSLFNMSSIALLWESLMWSFDFWSFWCYLTVEHVAKVCNLAFSLKGYYFNSSMTFCYHQKLVAPTRPSFPLNWLSLKVTIQPPMSWMPCVHTSPQNLLLSYSFVGRSCSKINPIFILWSGKLAIKFKRITREVYLQRNQALVMTHAWVPTWCHLVATI